MIDSGASLQIGTATSELACGSHQQAVREGGAVSLEMITESLSKVTQSADRAAAELAIPRLTRELGSFES